MTSAPSLMFMRVALRTSSTPSAKIESPSMPSFQNDGFQSSMPDVAQMSRPEAAMRGPAMTPSLTMSRIVTSMRCSAPALATPV